MDDVHFYVWGQSSFDCWSFLLPPFLWFSHKRESLSLCLPVHSSSLPWKTRRGRWSISRFDYQVKVVVKWGEKERNDSRDPLIIVGQQWTSVHQSVTYNNMKQASHLSLQEKVTGLWFWWISSTCPLFPHPMILFWVYSFPSSFGYWLLSFSIMTADLVCNKMSHKIR